MTIVPVYHNMFFDIELFDTNSFWQLTMDKDLQKILTCDHHDPFHYLGAHFIDSSPAQLILRTYQPDAKTVEIVTAKNTYQMSKLHEDGIFIAKIDINTLPDPLMLPFNYQYRISYTNGVTWATNDPYRFSVALGEQDRFLFNGGKNYKLYEHLGAHVITLEDVAGTVFRVWAPSAKSVSVIGNFNNWDRRPHQMRNLGISGIWELFIPHIAEHEVYKFSITSEQGDILEKADPFQFYGEIRPQTASVIKSFDNYRWNDEKWQRNKVVGSPYDKPISIYEVHPGTWRRDPNAPDRFLTYRELADPLVSYVKKLGFTHIELLPVMEHPLDESWGYQVTAPYAVSSRYGSVEDFMYFVDTCHQNDIGVILDWVPAHFPKDSHSLGRFDGTSLYEHEDSRLGSHPEWGTFIYNYGRNEVSNYLIANALFWLDKYHIDGLRVDAVASMLYLDYSRKDGEWLPNRHGGRENLEAIEFIKHLNSVVYDLFPNSLMIAEESTSFYGVSHPTNQGGLGFGFKWNMGWMNDILEYFQKDPVYRKHHHNNLTFSIMYAFSENFILPLSHDEVVHGKKSLIDKMPGDTWQKFANLRLLLLTMWLHPGKKLLFMGGEFGQWSEWNCKKSLDWHLLQEEQHNKLQRFMSELNRLYQKSPCLYQLDFSPEGFEWLDLEDRNNSVISFARYDNERKNHLVCVVNYTPQLLENYKVGLPEKKKYREIFCSDNIDYGGTRTRGEIIYSQVDTSHGQGVSHLTLTLPPLGGVVLEPIST